MWSCVNCGERDNRTSNRCRACRRPRRESRAVEVWKPEPADPADAPARSRVLPALPIIVLIGALAVAAVFGGPRLLGWENRSRPAAAPVPVPAAVPSGGVPILESAAIGLVTVHPEVDDPRADEVAAMFDTYFTGINERDYDAVAGVLDPAGDLDPTAPRQLAAFARGTSTTRDTDIMLRGLAAAGSGRLRAEVSFRSEQRAGHGPPGRLDETCTAWRVVYVLTPADDGYRMLRGQGASRPC